MGGSLRPWADGSNGGAGSAGEEGVGVGVGDASGGGNTGGEGSPRDPMLTLSFLLWELSVRMGGSGGFIGGELVDCSRSSKVTRALYEHKKHHRTFANSWGGGQGLLWSRWKGLSY